LQKHVDRLIIKLHNTATGVKRVLTQPASADNITNKYSKRKKQHASTTF